MISVGLEIGDRVRIKRGQPWDGEYGTYIGAEQTLVGLMYKIKLDNGVSVLQTRGHFIVNPIEIRKGKAIKER